MGAFDHKFTCNYMGLPSLSRARVSIPLEIDYSLATRGSLYVGK